MGDTRGGGDAFGEGGGEADRGGCSDQDPEGLDGGFRGALQVHIVGIRHHTDVQKRIPHLFQEALQGQGKKQGTAGIPLAHPTLRGKRGRAGGCALDDQGPASQQTSIAVAQCPKEKPLLYYVPTYCRASNMAA
jgi:hypothetical protein